MSEFESFEKKVVFTLLQSHLRPEQISAALEFGELVSFEFTGVGYFLTVRHPVLPKQRFVCSKPLVLGSSGDLDCGFVIFLEDGELTLDCHTYGEMMPEDFRKRQVEVGI